MNTLVTAEMKTKILNFNTYISISDKIDILSGLIRDFRSIEEDLQKAEISALEVGNKDKWRQLLNDGRRVSNYIGELARLKIKLIDDSEVIIEENYNRIMNFLQNI